MSPGKWYSLYPPGHAIALMPWVALGIPWLLNPLCGAASVVLIYIYGKKYYDKRVGLIAMVLATFSPFILYMSSEFMSHATCMLMLLIFGILFKKALSSESVGLYLASGFTLGMAAITRPYTAAAMSMPFFLRLGYQLAKRKMSSLKGAVAFCAVLTIFGLLYLGYNYRTNGSPFKMGHFMASSQTDIKLGFGEVNSEYHAVKEKYTLADGFSHLSSFIRNLNKQLYGWPVPDLIFVLLLFLSIRGVVREDFFQLSIFGSLAGAHMLFWYIDEVFGPRYVYEATPILIVLSARGIVEVGGAIERRIGFLKGRSGVVLGGIIGGFVIFSLLRTYPALYNKYSHNYVGAKPVVLDAVHRENIHNAVVFIRSNNIDYATNMIMYLNSPLLDTDVIYAHDWGPKNIIAMKQFPGRDYYLYQIYFSGTWARSEIVYEKLAPLRGPASKKAS